MVLRFRAGPIVHALSPLGLLTVSAILAIAGLLTLSTATGMWILLAATLYALGKTFFWPTMLGVVAEQTPKGGALTLNAISGIGMLAVGTLGTTYIGTLQAKREIQAVAVSELAKDVPGLVKDDALTVTESKTIYEILSYDAINDKKLEQQIDENVSDETKQEKIKKDLASIRGKSKQQALADMAMFPGVMLLAYLGLLLYFKSVGGYKAEVLTGHAAEDEKFTGGVEGAVE
ncbi:MAG: hypothetical protein N2C14_17045, partial [Planctomycetales bacterium]